MMTMRDAEPAMSDVDLRSFHDPLAALRLKGQSQLERLASELARAQQVLAARRAHARAVGVRIEAQAAALRGSIATSVDPAAYRSALDALIGQQAASAESARRSEQQRHAVAGLQGQWIQARLRLDGLLEQRAKAMAAHAVASRRHAAAEQDRDWSARTSLRVASRHAA